MKISRRGLDIQESPIRKFKPYADQAIADGVRVYFINIGQPDIPTPQPVWDAVKNFDEKVLSYGPAQGFLDLRQAMADYFTHYSIPLSSESAVADSGSEIIIPEPFYTNYNGFAAFADVKIVPLTLSVEEGFRLPSKEAFEAKITPQTRAILLNSPSNPTGTVYTPEELERVVDIAKRYDLYLIGDEVYKEFVYDDQTHKSILEYTDIEDRVIVIDSISKRFSCCGARIGAVVTRNADVSFAVLKFAQARLCPATLEQRAALALYRMGHDYFDPIREEYQRRRDVLFEGLRQISGVVMDKPQGAFYIIAQLPIQDSEHFVRWMLTDFRLDNETVMVAPAKGFYSSPGKGLNEVRIAYVLNESDMKRAIEVFKAGLERYKTLFP